MQKYKKKTFEQENAKTFLYFLFLAGMDFLIFFFSIFKNLSSADSKNRKLNCSGLNKKIWKSNFWTCGFHGNSLSGITFKYKQSSSILQNSIIQFNRRNHRKSKWGNNSPPPPFPVWFLPLPIGSFFFWPSST